MSFKDQKILKELRDYNREIRDASREIRDLSKNINDYSKQLVEQFNSIKKILSKILFYVQIICAIWLLFIIEIIINFDF